MEKISSTLSTNRLTIIAFAVVLIVVGFVFVIKNRVNIPYSATVAKVGDISITERDISYKFNVEKAYGNDSITGDEVLQVMIKDVKDQILAKDLNVFPMKVDIEAFRKHADSTSKAPEILNAVKNVFGEDGDSYDKIYVLPKLINPALHKYFSENEEINKLARSKIEKAFSEVNSGASFKDTASKNGLQYSTSTQFSIPPNLTAEMKKAYLQNKIPKSPIISIIEQLKDGEIYKEITEDQFTYTLVRLISSGKGSYNIETIISIKPSYDDWYKEQTAKIKVEILKEPK